MKFVHLVPKGRERHCSRPQLNRQRDIDNENTVLLNKIMHIMKRKNKSVTEARHNMSKEVLKNHLAQTQMSSADPGRSTTSDMN